MALLTIDNVKKTATQKSGFIFRSLISKADVTGKTLRRHEEGTLKETYCYVIAYVVSILNRKPFGIWPNCGKMLRSIKRKKGKSISM